MNNAQIIDEYIKEMTRGCMCTESDKDRLDLLIKEYDGPKDELVSKAIGRMVERNMARILSGTIGYPVP